MKKIDFILKNLRIRVGNEEYSVSTEKGHRVMRQPYTPPSTFAETNIFLSVTECQPSIKHTRLRVARSYA